MVTTSAQNQPSAPGQIDIQLTMLAVLIGLTIALLVAVIAIVVLVRAERRHVAAAPTVPKPAEPVLAESDRPNPVPAPGPARTWTGSYGMFAVGDPGRAAFEVVPKPDPRSWDRRETVLDGVRFAAVTGAVCDLRAASLRGLSHANAGTVRQDEYAYRLSADGRFVVVAVADGVSSGTRSEQAAMVVTRRGVDLIVHHLDQNGPDDIPWTRLTHKVAALVEERGRQIMDQNDGRILSTADIAAELAATALFAVLDLRREPEGFPVHLMTIGDTSGWLLRENRWVPLRPVKNVGAVVATSTTSALPLLPSRLEPPVVTWVRPGEALVLMSDGVGDPLGSGDGDVGAFLADRWCHPPRTGLEFAAHVGFARKSFDDDRTAVALWPTELGTDQP